MSTDPAGCWLLTLNELCDHVAYVRVPKNTLEMSCHGSPSEARSAFLKTTSAARAGIAGPVRQAFYGGVPAGIQQESGQRLPAGWLTITAEFYKRYILA